MKPEIIVNINVQVNNVPHVDAALLEKILTKNILDSVSAINYNLTPVDKTLDIIALVVLQFYPEISLNALKLPGRKVKHVIPRFIIIMLATTFHNIKSKDIAKYFGRERTCVNHAITTMNDLTYVDKPFQRHYLSIVNAYKDILTKEHEQSTITAKN